MLLYLRTLMQQCRAVGSSFPSLSRTLLNRCAFAKKKLNKAHFQRLKISSQTGSVIVPTYIMLSIFKSSTNSTKQDEDQKAENPQEVTQDLDLGLPTLFDPSTTSGLDKSGSNVELTSTKSFEPNDPRLRSSECLKNASGMAVDSTSAVLSQTVYAIIKIEQEYFQLVDVLIQLLEYQMQVLGHKSEEERMADLIMETRHEIGKVLQRKQDLQILFSSAEKLAEATAEITFITGAEYASTSIGERLHSAQTEVRRLQAKSQQADERLRRAQVKSIEVTNAFNEEQDQQLASQDEGNIGDDDDEDNTNNNKHDDEEEGANKNVEDDEKENVAGESDLDNVSSNDENDGDEIVDGEELVLKDKIHGDIN